MNKLKTNRLREYEASDRIPARTCLPSAPDDRRQAAWGRAFASQVIWMRAVLIGVVALAISGAFSRSEALTGGLVAFIATLLGQTWMYVEMKGSRESASRN